jgi:hypothetical protein
VGCPKTGTGFLQGVVWNNRDALWQQGLLLPGTSEHDHYQASVYARGAHAKRARADIIEATWRRIVDEVHHTNRDVLISHEVFAHASAHRAKFTIDALGGAETHVIVTARDLARQIPASWQQGVKQGYTMSLEEFVRDVVARGPRARTFWKMHDLADLCARWGKHLPASHVHLVTVPPSGADPALLWKRFASVLGVDADSVSLDQTSRNESLGRVEVELLRRVNERRGDRFPSFDDHLWFRDLLANEMLAKRPDREKFAIDPAVHDWVVRTSKRAVKALQKRGYDVVGDLAELIPPDEPERGGDPSQATEDELLTSAIETILDLLFVHRRTVRRHAAQRRSSAEEQDAGEEQDAADDQKAGSPAVTPREQVPAAWSAAEDG